MAAKTKCPQCGAKNATDARRCRVCANLLNLAAPEVEHRPKGLPDHIQRRVDAELEQQIGTDTFIPGVTPAAGSGGFGASPGAPDGFGSAEPAGSGFGPPPPPDAWAAPAPPAWAAPPPGATAPPPPPSWATPASAPPPPGAPPPPPAWATPAPPPPGASVDPQAHVAGGAAGEVPGWAPPPPGDEIIIEAPPRHVADVEPPPVADEAFEKFDPDALFRDMGRAPLPPPPPPPDELRLPPPVDDGPDPLWQIEVPDGASSAEIEAAAAKAMRDERLNRRPSFLDKVFNVEDGEDEAGNEPRPF